MSNTNDLSNRINDAYSKLSKGQKRLATYITDNYDKAVFLTAAKLGEVVGVSESTVVRFATHLGYKGYPEFQSALEELVRNKLNSIQRMEVTYGRIIGISFPRYSMRTLKAMEFANNRSAKVITLTDSVHSPMNLYSSCNLIADSDMASIVDSLVAPLSVINALIVALCMKKQNEVAKTLEMLEDIWDEYQVYENDEINYIDDSIKMRYGKVGDAELYE